MDTTALEIIARWADGTLLQGDAKSTVTSVCTDSRILKAGDLFVFCSDGVFEANDLLQREFGVTRLLQVIEESRQKSAQEIVDAIYAAVEEFRGEALPNDDMTAVAVKINA